MRSTNARVVEENEIDNEANKKLETRPQKNYKDIMVNVIDIDTQDELRVNIYND